jgi:hypothetical protein
VRRVIKNAKKDLDFELLRIIERGEYDAEWVREYNEDFM